MTTALISIAAVYGIPNSVENSFPHAAKPDAVYGTKKMMIKIAEIPSSSFESSRYRFEKKSGIVIEFVFALYLLSLFATISQFK